MPFWRATPIGSGAGGFRIRLPRPPALAALLRGHFFSGLLVVVPIGVIAWIAVESLQALWALSELFPSEWRPESWVQDETLASLLTGAFALGGALALAAAVSLVGWISKQYLGQKALEVLADWIQRIPVLRTIYSALDQLLRAVTAGGGQQFSRVVYVEYPRAGSWALAFVTGAAPTPPGESGHFLNLYVPTTPNPTSGFHLMVAEAQVRESGMRVEDAFKTILSLGIARDGGRG